MRVKYIIALCLALSFMPAKAQKKNIKTESFKVFGVCVLCKERIETTLANYNVYKADWSIDTKMLTVSYDSTKLSKTKIEKKLASAGHDTEDFQATDKTYNSLPQCCYYERYVKPGPPVIPVLVDGIQKNIVLNSFVFNLTGVVLEEDRKGKMIPLVSATVYSLNTKHSGFTDSSGVFHLSSPLPARIIISYVGFKTDTINIFSPDVITIVLKNASSTSLQQVVVSAKNQRTYISSISTTNTLNIGSRELAKAACCNLSESFETSPSVDVSYADAVTGIKQIQLLGLSGNYTQITTENIPEIRGLAGSYGLTFIPGPWIEGIQLTKGAGSVVNGYESIAGQINIEEKKPDKAEKFFINAYANNNGRLETTVSLAQKLNDNWSMALLTHANGVISRIDDNKDGFLDIPLGRQFNIMNRWKYTDTKGIIAQVAIKALSDRRQAGETGFNPATDKLTTNKYGVGIAIEQYELSGKLGYVFPQQKYKSVGFIVSAIHYQNDSYYGLNKYDGKQESLYANLIYQSIIGNSFHKYRAGLSFVNDNYYEVFDNRTYQRKETVPGAFFEYTYNPGSKFSAIAGLRADHHNQYGLILTPRLHLKYDISTKTNLRFSAGSGFRVANIFAENSAVFVSARQYNILNPSTTFGYGLDPEKARNYGFSFIQQFKINKHPGTISLDFYHTNFKNQTVVDLDAGAQKIHFYSLVGQSFSNSFQAELNFEPAKRFELRTAYRWLDVQTNYGGVMMTKPLVAKHRAFINLAYETGNHWKFDFTTQWFSKKRLPNTGDNPADKQMGNYSPSYIQMSGQLTKQFGTHWDFYLGAENITNFTQSRLILSADQPFGPYFDGSMTWGPVNGRVIYLGMRFKMT